MISIYDFILILSPLIMDSIDPVYDLLPFNYGLYWSCLWTFVA